jgi:hypothetical protein
MMAAIGAIVKLIITCFVAAWLICGCVAGSTLSHEDSPGVVNRDEGPILCLDATPPPCTTPRD